MHLSIKTPKNNTLKKPRKLSIKELNPRSSDKPQILGTPYSQCFFFLQSFEPHITVKLILLTKLWNLFFELTIYYIIRALYEIHIKFLLPPP